MTAADVTAVIIFAKAPRPGTVKTRLVPLLGTEGAAALHARFVKRTLETAREASLRPIELHCAPDVKDPLFQYCASRYGITVRDQVGGNLGSRMLAAFESALAVHSRVLIVGTDCPALAPRHLNQAERALRDGSDAVFIPCEDGGYALIGLTRADARLFDRIEWGSDSVMTDTRVRLSGLGWRWQELETLWDVDRPEDYRRLMDSGLLDDRRATA